MEFALVLPLLIALLFGVIEFGWAMAQNLEVKHVAREVSRLVAVNDPGTQIPGRVCGATLAEVTSASAAGGTQAGEAASVTVVADFSQLTGLFNWALSSLTNLTSTVEVQLEQDLTAWSGTTC